MITETLLAIANEGSAAVPGEGYLGFVMAAWAVVLAPIWPIVSRLLMDNTKRVKSWEFLWLNFVVALGLWVLTQLPNLDPRVHLLEAPVLGMIAAFAIILASVSKEKYPKREMAILSRLVIPFALAAMSYAFSLPTLTLLSLPGQALLRQLFVLLCFCAACLVCSCGLSRVKVESWFRTTAGETVQSQHQTVAKKEPVKESKE